MIRYKSDLSLHKSGYVCLIRRIAIISICLKKTFKKLTVEYFKKMQAYIFFKLLDNSYITVVTENLDLLYNTGDFVKIL